MNVLMVVASMNPANGGVCQGIRNTIPELEKQQIHNEVVCLDDSDSLFLKKDPFIIHALGPVKSSWNYSAKLVPWLLENLARFDAVIINGLWLYTEYAVIKAMGMLKKKRTKKNIPAVTLPKIYIMPHGMLDPYFQRAPGRKLKAFRNWLYWKLIESRIINNATGLLFTCEAELQLARVPFRPYKPKQEINVGFGIEEPPSYKPQMQNAFLELCPELTKHSYFLFLSRIHEKKGIDMLLNAYSEVFTKMNKTNAEVSPAKLSVDKSANEVYRNLRIPKLVIAGPGGETPYGLQLKKMVSDNPQISNSVFFPGMLSGDVKWGAFYGCEAFILPSHQENFGIAVVEALACSKPVLISNQVNIWKEISDYGAGIVADDTLQGTQELFEKWLLLTNDQKIIMQDTSKSVYTDHFAVKGATEKLLNALK